ncbi:ATP-binding protein [Vibrio rarus]|uniref:ATP-binding protein n=1 Tax=Vibrio rarus TaxID=413403 RepID=UPI0021C4C786|nr:ATP-binding protein [Vibrio rarus]
MKGVRFSKGQLVGEYTIQFPLTKDTFRVVNSKGALFYLKSLSHPINDFPNVASNYLSNFSIETIDGCPILIENYIQGLSLDKYLNHHGSTVQLIKTLLKELFLLLKDIGSEMDIGFLTEVTQKDIIVDFSDDANTSFKVINLDRLLENNASINESQVIHHFAKLSYEILFNRSFDLSTVNDFWIDDSELGSTLSKLLKVCLVTPSHISTAKTALETLAGKIELPTQTLPSGTKVQSQVESGKGFSAIAGMEGLKETLRVDVIEALQNKELYKSYGLSIPNGILFYGPPGCGKTFFAQKLSEEIGISFYTIAPSDIHSKWVNESQEKVKVLFNKAEVNAPAIIFIDEIDAIAPARGGGGVSHMNLATVNELLTQINNCGDRGIFVIGATNLPSSVDSALLRTGRFDKKVLIPAPDKQARKSLFKTILSERPLEDKISYTRLSRLTENYVASDIYYICNESSRKALVGRVKITQEMIESVIMKSKPSITLEQIEEFSKEL